MDMSFIEPLPESADFVLGPIQTKWIEALESGEYKQGYGRLRRGEGDNKAFCCLGVLCEVMGIEWRPSNGGGGYVEGHGPMSHTVNTSHVSGISAGLYTTSGDFRPKDGVDLMSGQHVLKWPGASHSTLIGLNDRAQLPFASIAAAMRRDPARFFRHSA